MSSTYSESLYDVTPIEVKFDAQLGYRWSLPFADFRWCDGFCWIQRPGDPWVQLAKLHCWELALGFTLGMDCARLAPMLARGVVARIAE